MSFLLLVQQFQLGQWHELIAAHMIISKPLCLPILQADFFISDSVIHTVVTDFTSLHLCYIDKKDPNYLCIDIESICSILSLLNADIKLQFTRQSLSANSEIPARQLNL